MQTTMTVKGQVTIPKVVRERAGLRPGMRVDVGNDANGHVTLHAVADSHDDPARDDAARARFEAVFDKYIARRPPGDSWSTLPADDYVARFAEPLEPFERDDPTR